jgi:pilus assembly protein FimV
VVTIVKKSKVRLLTKTLAVVSLLAPASGHPLGIGEIKLHSALNQNLDAEIALTLSGESVADVKVNLAPPEKFDEAGVAWNYFLSKIKFETITQSNGSAVIKLTSKEALKEPFLDFLLEVSWPKGNLYREFTVLVDPPSVYNPVTIPASTSTENYTQSPAASFLPQSHANGQTSEGEYGPTLANDTLWSVAERVRGQSGATVEQMMMALYEANPQAFYKGNVHALTTGKTLKIPGKEAVLNLSRNQALAEFNRHTKAWKNHSAPASVETTDKHEKNIDNQLTLIAPTKAAVADRAVVKSANERTSGEKKAAKGETDSALQNKISDLEKQLAMMQELIALKDQQLAALQNRAQTAPVEQEPAASAEIADVKPVEQATPAPQQAAGQPAQPAQSAASEVEPEKPADQAPAVAQPAQPERPAPSEAISAKPAEQVVPAAQPVQPVPGEVATATPATPAAPATQPVVAKPIQPAKPQAQPPVPEASSLLDAYYLGMGGVGTGVLALLGWLWWRKRKVYEETNSESMFASTSMIQAAASDDSVSVPVVEDSVAAHENEAGTVGESSFLSEFTPSDFDSFDTDQGEIDPISEADVYLAYGRYQQAEELIRQAIKDQPNRDECKLKLLEIFYANENKEAFEAYANELVEAGKRNEADFWEKAAEMGREICPDSPLFSSGDNPFAVSDEKMGEDFAVNDGVIKENTENLNVEPASFEGSAGEDSLKDTAEPADNGADFDSASAESFVGKQQNNEDIDFGLNTFSMDSKELDEAEQGVIASSTSSVSRIEEIDFNPGSFSVGDKAPDNTELSLTAAASQLPEIEEIDFDLGSFSVGDKASDNTEPSLTAAAPQLPEIEEIDFDLGSFSAGDKASDNAEPSATAAAPKLPEIEEIDFDLGSFSAAGSESGAEAGKKMEFESLEFDFNSKDAETKGIGDLDFHALDSDVKDLDVDFSADGSLNFNDDSTGDFDFDFDLDLPSISSGKDANQQDEFGVSDLTDMDELETKLDLAKAYVDMGDAAAAKELANEVLEQGTDEQKKVAQALLDELG